MHRDRIVTGPCPDTVLQGPDIGQGASRGPEGRAGGGAGLAKEAALSGYRGVLLQPSSYICSMDSGRAGGKGRGLSGCRPVATAVKLKLQFGGRLASRHRNLWPVRSPIEQLLAHPQCCADSTPASITGPARRPRVETCKTLWPVPKIFVSLSKSCWPIPRSVFALTHQKAPLVHPQRCADSLEAASSGAPAH